jgi:hypothetical protein
LTKPARGPWLKKSQPWRTRALEAAAVSLASKEPCYVA